MSDATAQNRSAEHQSDGPGVTRVLIVDDNPTMRGAIRMMLALESDLAVCGEASSVWSALDACEQLRPDAVLIDISLRGQDGLDLVRQLVERQSPVTMIVFSLHDEAEYIDAARATGAHGYARKGESPDELLHCMRSAIKGTAAFVGPEQR